jgi:hypothetical protein
MPNQLDRGCPTVTVRLASPVRPVVSPSSFYVEMHGRSDGCAHVLRPGDAGRRAVGVVTSAPLFSGRAFAGRFDVPIDAVWQPLEAVARVARSSAHLPSFHEGEFMFMGSVSNARRRLDIHLYKHVDTRRYLNLDATGNAYAYLGPVSPEIDTTTGGRYRLYRSLRDAMHHVGFGDFEGKPSLYRSFPPEAWPPDALSMRRV